MADEKDLFAPPSVEEEALFAAPTEDEEALFAAPTAEEVEPEAPIQGMSGSGLDAMGEAAEEMIAPAVVGGTIAAAQKGAEKVASGLDPLAESMAYKAVGGESTPVGRKFIKNQMAQLGLPDTGITEQSLGRKVLDEGLLGKAGLKGSADAFEEVDQKLLDQIKVSDDIVGQTTSKKDLDELLGRYKELADVENLDPATERNRDIIEEFKRDAPHMQGERSGTELERIKRDIHKDVTFDPKKSAKEVLMKSKGRAAREAVEDIVSSDLGPEILDDFKGSKKATGELGILRNLMLEKSYRDRIGPDISVKDLATAGVFDPVTAVASKAISKKGAGVTAKAAEGLSDLLKKVSDIPGAKAAWKALPFVGAGATFGAARAEGADTEQALAETAVDEATDLLGPVKMALDPTKAGPDKASLEGQFERGEIDAEQYSKALEAQKQGSEKPQLKTDSKRLNEYKSILNKIESIPGTEAYQEQLQKLDTADDEEKAKIKFNLMQQPAFRRLLD